MAGRVLCRAINQELPKWEKITARDIARHQGPERMRAGGRQFGEPSRIVVIESEPPGASSERRGSRRPQQNGAGPIGPPEKAIQPHAGRTAASRRSASASRMVSAYTRTMDARS